MSIDSAEGSPQSAVSFGSFTGPTGDGTYNSAVSSTYNANGTINSGPVLHDMFWHPPKLPQSRKRSRHDARRASITSPNDTPSTSTGPSPQSFTLNNSTSADQSNIPSSRPIVREKHKKHRLRDVDRKSICVYHLTHPNARQEDIGAYFGVERSTISKILKEKDRWLSISEEDECDQSAKHRYLEFPRA
jgi:hypothetical protein